MPISKNSRGGESEYTFRFRYETLRSLLLKNVSCLQILSNLEADLNHLTSRDFRIQLSVRRLINETMLMAQELNLLSSDRYYDLYAALERIRRLANESFESTGPRDPSPALPLENDNSLDFSLVGGKAGGLALLKRHFPESVPAGFTVTTTAYHRLIEENNLKDRLILMFQDIDVLSDQHQFRSRIEKIRSWILSAAVPEPVRLAIREHSSRLAGSPEALWAVRSSAADEDGRYSFAGQFESRLGVRADALESAYLQVLASRFTERAVRYRLHVGIREVETPMAVLFMPMVEAAAAGIVHTSDPNAPSSNAMIVHAAPGLGDKIAQGIVKTDTFILAKDPAPAVRDILPAGQGGQSGPCPAYLSEAAVLELGGLARKAEAAFGHPLEMEWAVDRRGRLWLLQARRLNTVEQGETTGRRRKKQIPLLEGGLTVFPGQAEGQVAFWEPGCAPEAIPNGAVLVVKEPIPELATVLPKAAALLAAEGNPAGHASNLVREFSIPSIFQVGRLISQLVLKNVVSVDATDRVVYDGSVWPGMKERVMARIASSRRKPPSGPLHELVIQLNLVDPDGSSFKAGSCRSVHDVLRFVHEMSIRSLFGFGDESKSGLKDRRYQLETDRPVKLIVLDLDGSLAGGKTAVTADEIPSIPFRAFWKGMSDSRLGWTQHWQREMSGVPPSFRKAVLEDRRGPRRPSDSNYAMIARNYLNLNAKFAYHYAMVDAVAGLGSESNHIHFRFRGGGAGEEKKERRTRFLEEVLCGLGFGTSRCGDMVTAWFSRYPLEKSKAALEQLGRLTICAQELDAVMKNDSDVKYFARSFLDEKYEVFL